MDDFNKFKSYPQKRKKSNKKKKKVKIKKRKVLKLAFLVVIILAVLSFGMILRAALSIDQLQATSPWIEELDKLDKENNETTRNYVNTVFVLFDPEENLDYIIVLNHEKEMPGDEKIEGDKAKIQGVLLPANTYLNIPGMDMSTLEEAYNQGETSLLVDTVRENLDISIHNVLEVRTALIEELGSKLMTEDALEFSYFNGEASKENAKMERFFRKQDLLSNFEKEYLERSNFWNRSNYLNKIADHVGTNLSWQEASVFIDMFKEDISREDIKIIPGVTKEGDEEYKWVLDNDKAWEIVGQTFHLEEFVEEELAPQDITVEVLAGDIETAEEVGNKLKEEGFDVVDIKKEKQLDYTSNVVISRKEPEMAAKAVALEVEYADLLRGYDPDASVMVTVIVGEN